MCASSPYTTLPLIKFLYVRQGLRENENTGNPILKWKYRELISN